MSSGKGQNGGMRSSYRRMESSFDSLNKYRGIATVISVPLFLILTVLALMPRAPQYGGDFSRSEPFAREKFEDVATGKEQYAIIIDAGSTGSRVHVYKFLIGRKGQLELQFDKFEQLKPGLSSYADTPTKAAESLQPLLETAMKTVPKKLQASTPVMVGATAGLRLLPDGKADIILDEVRTWLKKYPFKFDAAKDVKILSGVDEGAFAWLTLNYLLGKLGGVEHDTVAAIDLGGGSVQEAFALTPEEAKTAPHPDYVTYLKGGGREYAVYVYSYLGYGLMAGRAAVITAEDDKDSHPCVPKGYSGVYEYGGKKHEIGGNHDGASHEECVEAALNALQHTKKCGAPQTQCSFNGAWGGSRLPSVFYVSSYFWDRATDAGLIIEETAIQMKISPNHFTKSAQKACSADDKVKDHFPNVNDDLMPFFCMDLTYAHTLLTKGFKIPEEHTITLVKQVEYQGQNIEAAWPLGAAINALG